MKKVAFAAIVLLMTMTMGAQTQAPKINFETKAHDFGKIKEADGPVTYNFKFTNIGNEPLLLKGVKASCGCTTPRWTKEPVLPGDSGQIAVTYNPRNRPGSFRKTVTVTSNSEGNKAYLSISGKVSAREKTVAEKYPFSFGALRVKKTHLSFFNIKNTEQKEGTLEVINTTAQPIKVTFPDLPDHITAEDVTVAAGKTGQLVFNYDASKKDDWGYVTDNVICWVDGSKVNTPLKLSATITEDFSDMTEKELEKAPKITLNTRKIDFGSVKRGEQVKKTFTIKNTGKSVLVIHAVKSTSSLITCAVEKQKVATGKEVTVEVTLDTTKTKGRQYKTVNVITNDPSVANITFILTGTVL